MSFFTKLAQTKPGSTSRELEEAKAMHKVRANRGSGMSMGFDLSDPDDDDEEDTGGITVAIHPDTGKLEQVITTTEVFGGQPLVENLTIKTHYFDHVPGPKAAYVITLNKTTYVVFRRGSSWDYVQFENRGGRDLAEYIKKLADDDTSVYNASPMAGELNLEESDDDDDWRDEDDEQDPILSFTSDKLPCSYRQIAGPIPEEE